MRRKKRGAQRIKPVELYLRLQGASALRGGQMRGDDRGGDGDSPAVLRLRLRTQTDSLDGWAGLSSRMVSEHARRVVSLAGSTWPFDEASAKLLELCRMRISDDTIERVCQEEGQRAGASRTNRPIILPECPHENLHNSVEPHSIHNRLM
jgi:hypothetical protein